jgi:DNA polymerase (family 10)
VEQPLIPLGRAHLLASSMFHEARRGGLSLDVLMAVGPLRRYAPAVDRVALLAIVAPPSIPRTLKAFSRLPSVTAVASQSAQHITVRTARGVLTLHAASPDDAGAALVWHTGSAAHVDALQVRADGLGLKFADGALAASDGSTPVPCPTEADFYAKLGLPFIPPELRGGDGEIGAAEQGALPALLSEEHIRGDLHMHTIWSDGSGTVEDMVGAARQLGYEYVAITDHSQRAWSSRKLLVGDIPGQREEIETVRSRIPTVEVLHGIEVDIMHDGSLDFGDEVLAEFDIVLASLHDWGGHDGERLTERYLRAIEHPLVNVITHPANRSPALSDGYQVDFDRLFVAAAATGTAMEIDGAPGHLDMDGVLARRAVAAGVTLVVDSDCHRVDALARQMQFGVGTARRGWVEPKHVLNTRPIADVRAFVERKRRRR